MRRIHSLVFPAKPTDVGIWRLYGLYSSTTVSRALTKVEEKVEEAVDRVIKTSGTRDEFEWKLDPRDVSYKPNDETKEGK
ncbi:MAG: hypothetical protein ACRD99_06745 [Nitrososphaera sp.]